MAAHSCPELCHFSAPSFFSALDAIIIVTVATVQTHKGVNKMAEPTTVAGQRNDTELVQESLVEEVSIDGMCGVY